jgi:cytochrome P450
VLRRTDAFSNASGFKAPGIEVPPEERVLGELDPPVHTTVRRVMVTALTPSVVHAAEEFAETTATGLLAALPPRGADLVPGFTVPLPNRVTVHLLGLDPADADQIARWAKALMESSFPATNRTERGEGFAGAFPEFAGYIDDQIAARIDAREPDDGVITRLVRLEVDGERMSLVRVRALVRNLITGGLTTTSQLLGNLLHTLLTDADVRAAIDRDVGVLDHAIEESLRLSPPILFVPRGCLQEVEIDGCPVPAGQRVVVGTGSANRDERVFDTPDEFRLDRDNSDQHLTFGYGPHVCPGATLARMIARVAVRAFCARFPAGSIRLEPGFEFDNVDTFFEIGPKRLPVVS